jgi:dihydroorotate dehydrogenase electron transfer subunit
MTDKFNETCIIISQEQQGTDVYSMWIKTENMADYARPGQFISIYSNDRSRLLPRPISICEVNKSERSLRLVYRVLGSGTKEFSCLKPGDTLRVLGPLGNGFPLKEKKALLIGGGIGIPPMLELAKELRCEKQIILGFRDEIFLTKELEEQGMVYVATEDGSVGTKGNVLDIVREHNLDAEIIYACGPTPMLRAIKEYAGEKGIECYLSLEERMACGVGACLACVCKAGSKDRHSNVNNKRICKDGPVFLSTEVEL